MVWHYCTVIVVIAWAMAQLVPEHLYVLRRVATKGYAVVAIMYHGTVLPGTYYLRKEKRTQFPLS